MIAKASALQKDGRLPEALALLNGFLKNNPSDIEALKRLALVQMQTGAAAEAFETVRAAQKIRPQSKSVLQVLAVAAMGVGEWAVAIQCFEVLTKDTPDFALYYQEWSRAEYELRNVSRAIARYQDFLSKITKATPEHHFVLGRLFFQNRQPAKAARALDTVLAGGFVNSEMLAIRANCYLHAGAQDEAKAFFERAIEMNPDNVEAHLQYRQLVKTGADDPIFEQMQALQAKGTLAPEKEMILNFLLGNLHNGLKEYEKAFPYYQKGNKIGTGINAAAGHVYDAKKVAEEFDLQNKAFASKPINGPAGGDAGSELPVFIVGMPRSGTTLLEQIITAHPKVEGRGELDSMHYIYSECEEVLQKSPAFDMGKILHEKGNEWRARYLEALAPSKAETSRVSDKLPANFRSLGLISALFPKAKIIHIRRNPLDTSVSIFNNIFDKGHPYATDLVNIGDYYRQYKGQMAVWKEKLSIPILEIDYEDLVTHQEEKSKEVIAFLGLDWDPVCLNFHTQKKAAMTISSIQVRKPMTTSAIARWKRYKAFLAPLEEGLGKDQTALAKSK